MKQKELLEFLKTPRGIVNLFAATFLVSALLAVFVAFKRPFFEKYILEKYPTTTELSAKIMRESVGKTGLPTDLKPEHHDAFYESWMSAPDTLDADLPRKMLAAAPQIYLDRARRTLVSGNNLQREKARDFLKRSGNPAAAAVLEADLKRAELDH